MLTVREPRRKDVLKVEGLQQKLSLHQSMKIVFSHPKTFISICLGTAFTAFASYGCTAWIPTYFFRTFGWPVPKAGLIFGLILVAGSISGVIWGGWYADRLKNKGISAGRVRIGLIAGIGILLSCCIPLISNPNIVVTLLFIPAFFIASPMGASTAALQELMPNQVRALTSAIFLFLINMIGLGLGPYVVAFFTDSVFKNENDIRYSLTALLAIGGGLAAVCYRIGYRGYRELHKK